MKQPFKTLIAATAAVAIVVAASPASALTTAEIGCHAAIGKNLSKYQASLAKNLIGCHKARIAGKIGANTLCNTTAGADTKGKLITAQLKVTSGINGKCLLTGDPLTGSEAVLAQYPRCPSPAATSDDLGATTGIDTFTELATCQMRLAEAYINDIGEQALGLPALTPLLSKTAIGCHGAIGKTLSNVVKTVSGTFTACQAADEKAGGDLVYNTCATSGDIAGKAAAAIAAMKSAIDVSCVTLIQAEWAQFGTCGQSTTLMKGCAVDKITDPTSRGLAAAAMGLPGTCAAFADVIINAGYGQKLSMTRLDSGYTGLAHDVDVVDLSLGGVKLENCNADCENCDVRIDPTNGYCRCESDSTRKCDVVNGNDNDVAPNGCSGLASQQCNCMFGPPLAISSGGTPVCVVNRFAQEFTGGTSVVGSYDVATRTRAVVHLGISQTQPCPTCNGDATLNDNVKGGTCDGGQRTGLNCDSNANHPDFGPTSFDCLPASGANVTGAGLNLALRFTDGTVSLTAAVGGANCASGTCHCSHCTLDSQVGCSVDADCAAVGAGTCGVNLGGANPRQNSCTGGPAACIADGSGLGACDFNGPNDTFCDGDLRKNGRGFIPCTSDLDCDALDPDCSGGDCGLCGAPTSRSCFLPNISATGKSGIFNSEGVSAFCSAATGNPGVNSAGGLPGPGRVKLDFDFTVYCSDHSTKFQFPSGFTCP